MRLFTKLSAALAVAAVSWAANAGPILIVNGASATSETTTTAAITSNLSTLHIAAGNTVTIVDGVPADLSPYSQVWDIRFSNSSPLTAPVRGQYLAYLQGGGGMFVMGENAGFATRNNSVLALIAEAGGGNLVYITPASLQIVNAPFDAPNAIDATNVNYAAPGGVTSPGTGQYITQAGANGTGIAWGVGDLVNALAGALTVIFDVNFMQNAFDLPDSQNLTKNLIAFVGDEVEPPVRVPEPSILSLLGASLLGFAFIRRRRLR